MRSSVCSLAIVSIASIAQAGGIDFPDQGVQALGRGGAFVAKADDGTAIYFNPAGLAKQRGTRVLVHSNLVDEDLSFRRSGDFDEVHNTDGIFWLPFVAASSDFGLEKLTFSLGIYGPSATRYRTFPVCLGIEEQDPPDYCGPDAVKPSKEKGFTPPDQRYAPQRYMGLRRDLIVLHPTLAVAYRPWSWLDLGFDFQATYASARIEQASNVLGSDLPSGDVRVVAGGRNGRAVDPFTPTFLIGTLVRPPLPLPDGHGIEVGLSFRTPFTLEMEGDVDLELSRTTLEAGATYSPATPRATLSTRLPAILRGGIRYAVQRGGFEIWDIEIDATYEPYSSVDSIDVNFAPPLEVTFVSSPSIETFELTHKWRDTGSVRLGGGYNFARVGPGSLSLRAGGNYEGAAAPKEYTQLDFSPFRRLGAAGGIAYRWRNLTFSVAYEHLWTESRTVTDSEVRTFNVLDPASCDPDEVVPGRKNTCDAVGDGTYHVSHDIFAVGAELHFDKLFR